MNRFRDPMFMEIDSKQMIVSELYIVLTPVSLHSLSSIT